MIIFAVISGASRPVFQFFLLFRGLRDAAPFLLRTFLAAFGGNALLSRKGVMNKFIGKLSGLFKREKTAAVTSGSGRVSCVLPSASYGRDGACIATVYRCVRLLSESVAMLPLRYLESDARGIKSERDRWMNYLLQVQPNENYSAFDFMRLAVAQILVRGNAYIMPVSESGFRGFDRLVLLSPGAVSVNPVTGIYTVSDTTNNIFGTYLPKEIIHLRNNNAGGLVGQSVISAARNALSIAAQGDAETLDRFKTGGAVRGLVCGTGDFAGTGYTANGEIERTAQDLDADFNVSGRRIVSVPEPLQFTQLSMSSADLQFLESRKFEVLEICRFFGVHPSFVFSDTSSNYKSAENANTAFLAQTLNPMLRMIENEFQRKLCGWRLHGSAKFEFDRSALYASDPESRARYEAQQLGNGTRTVNELRAADNRPPVEGGDKPLVSANLRTIDEINTNDTPQDAKD